MNKIEETLYRIVKIFHQIGIWRPDEESVACHMCRKFFYSAYFISFLIFTIACAFLAENDSNDLIFLMDAVLVVAVLEIKLIYLLWKKNEILRFLYGDTENGAVAISLRNTDDEKLNYFVKFVKAYNFMLAICAVFFNTVNLPMFSDQKRLPFFIPYTLTWPHSEIIYWIAYVFVAFGIVFSAVFNLITSLIWYIMLNYAVEYEVLGDKLKDLGVNDTVGQSCRLYKKSDVQNGNLLELFDLVKAHRNLFKTIAKFKSEFTVLFFAQISTSGIIICMAIYNLAYNFQDNVVQLTIFVVVLLYGFFDIFLVMYLANEIKAASDRLSYCLFESNWTEQSEAYKKCMILICEIAKQPQELMIWMYPMNLHTFTQIINGAYRMFNLLQNFD